MNFRLKMTWEAGTAAQARTGASSAVAMRLCPHARPPAVMCHQRLKILDKRTVWEYPQGLTVPLKRVLRNELIS